VAPQPVGALVRPPANHGNAADELDLAQIVDHVGVGGGEDGRSSKAPSSAPYGSGTRPGELDRLDALAAELLERDLGQVLAVAVASNLAPRNRGRWSKTQCTSCFCCS